MQPNLEKCNIKFSDVRTAQVQRWISMEPNDFKIACLSCFPSSFLSALCFACRFNAKGLELRGS